MGKDDVRNRLLKLIQDANAQKADALERVQDEAKTSMFVFICMYDLFEWDAFREIIPQKQGHGFIDYLFQPKVSDVACYVEVKRFVESLKVEHVRKYLVNREDGCQLRFGILTNLRQWHIYAYSTKAGPGEPVKVLDGDIATQADLRHLEDCLTYSSGAHGFKNLRDAYVASPDVIVNELRRADTINMVSQSIRSVLTQWRKEVPLPRENATLENAIRMVLKGEQWKGRDTYRITSSECRTALLNRDSLFQVQQQLQEKLFANLPLARVRSAIEWHIEDAGANASQRDD